MKKWWRNHSLTIVLTLTGVALIIVAFTHDEGKLFDLWLTLGGGSLTVALMNLLSLFFRETAKPED